MGVTVVDTLGSSISIRKSGSAGFKPGGGITVKKEEEDKVQTEVGVKKPSVKELVREYKSRGISGVKERITRQPGETFEGTLEEYGRQTGSRITPKQVDITGLQGKEALTKIREASKSGRPVQVTREIPQMSMARESQLKEVMKDDISTSDRKPDRVSGMGVYNIPNSQMDIQEVYTKVQRRNVSIGQESPSEIRQFRGYAEPGYIQPGSKPTLLQKLEYQSGISNTPVKRIVAGTSAVLLSAGQTIVSPFIKPKEVVYGTLEALYNPVGTIKQIGVQLKTSPATTIGQIGGIILFPKVLKTGKNIGVKIIESDIDLSIRGKKAVLRDKSKRITSKIELRKRSYQQQYNPNYFYDVKSGELGARFRTDVLKLRGVKEKIVRKDPMTLKTTEIREVGRSPITGGKETLVSRVGTESFISKQQGPRIRAQRSQATNVRSPGNVVNKMIESGEGVLIAKQSVKMKPFEVIKREPLPTPSSDIRPPLRNLYLEKKVIERPTIKLPEQKLIEPKPIVRPGFRPGTYAKIQERVNILKQERAAQLGASPFESLSDVLARKKKIPTIYEEFEIKGPIDLAELMGIEGLPKGNIARQRVFKIVQEPIVSSATRRLNLIKSAQFSMLMSRQRSGLGLNQFPILSVNAGQASTNIQRNEIISDIDISQATDLDLRQDIAQDTIMQTKQPSKSIYKTPTGDRGGTDTYFQESNYIPKPPRDIVKTPRTIKERIPTIPVRLFPPSTKSGTTMTDKLGSNLEQKQGYNVYIKRRLAKLKGKKRASRGFEKANTQPLSKQAALGKMMDILDTYTNRSGKIVKVNRQVKSTRPDLVSKYNQLKSKFRQSKSNTNTYVEKTMFAIDSREEKEGIPFKAARLRRGRVSTMARRKKKRKSATKSKWL